ncbi:NUDIX domain-containing protein [uncultured Microscilla sp.]|uniref:NUDIX hydrolase n=1 Tax=uncultured Microscilla sp. TaxID=432653 RepID=UPI002607BC56|nr:NUDIX domain-containing protein [uncultured Microscilla sp.]
MENLDYFDDNLNYLGTASRKEIHEKGLWHKTIHCWILRTDSTNKQSYVVFQQRSAQKEYNPLTLDISAAGHYGAGETDKEATREIEEELGIQVQWEKLRFLGILQEANIVQGQHGSIAINREFCYTYFLADNRPLSSYRIQEAELATVVQIPVNEGLKLFSGETSNVQGRNIHDELTTYSIADFLPRDNTYYLKIFVMAERYFEGKKHLVI